MQPSFKCFKKKKLHSRSPHTVNADYSLTESLSSPSPIPEKSFKALSRTVLPQFLYSWYQPIPSSMILVPQSSTKWPNSQIPPQPNRYYLRPKLRSLPIFLTNFPQNYSETSARPKLITRKTHSPRKPLHSVFILLLPQHHLVSLKQNNSSNNRPNNSGGPGETETPDKHDSLR